ncbi:MAG: hypothetical protein ACT4OX_11020 [Actinomycetota bacterium]
MADAVQLDSSGLRGVADRFGAIGAGALGGGRLASSSCLTTATDIDFALDEFDAVAARVVDAFAVQCRAAQIALRSVMQGVVAADRWAGP